MEMSEADAEMEMKIIGNKVTFLLSPFLFFFFSKCRGKFRLVPTLPSACSCSHAAQQHSLCKQMLQPCLQIPQAWM